MQKSHETKRSTCASAFLAVAIALLLGFVVVCEQALAKSAVPAMKKASGPNAKAGKISATKTAKAKKTGKEKDDEVDLTKTSMKGGQKITCGEEGAKQRVVYEARRGQWINVYSAQGKMIGRAADARLMADVDDSSLCESLKPSGFKAVNLTAVKSVASTIEAEDGQTIAQMTPVSPFGGVDMSGNPMMFGMNSSPMYFGNLNNMLLSSTGDDYYDRRLRDRSYDDDDARSDHRLEVDSQPPSIPRTGPYVDISAVPNFLSSPVCDCGGGCSMSSDFGPRTPPYISPGHYGSAYHGGNDLRAAVGTPVIAAADGIVKEIGSNATGDCGIWVLIEHAPNIETRMCHMRKDLKVTVGSPLRRGALVGYSGNTGPVGLAAHLHFELRINDVPVDPQTKFALSSQSFGIPCNDPNPGAIAQSLPENLINPAAPPRVLASPDEIKTEVLPSNLGDGRSIDRQ